MGTVVNFQNKSNMFVDIGSSTTKYMCVYVCVYDISIFSIFSFFHLNASFSSDSRFQCDVYADEAFVLGRYQIAHLRFVTTYIVNKEVGIKKKRNQTKRNETKPNFTQEVLLFDCSDVISVWFTLPFQHSLLPWQMRKHEKGASCP